MEHFVTTFAQHGYVALFVLLWIDTMGLPLPSEIPLLFAGFLVSRGEIDFVGASLVSAAGALGGSLLAYSVSRRYGRAAILRWGRRLLITEEHVHIAERWFERRGPAAVFICRMIPLARTLVSIPAGIAEMDLVRFSGYTFAGSLPWAFGLIGFGWALGENWRTVLGSFSLTSIAIGSLLAVAIVVWFMRRRARARVRAEEEAPSSRPS